MSVVGRLLTDPAVFSYKAQNTVAAYTAIPNCTCGGTVKGFSALMRSTRVAMPAASS